MRDAGTARQSHFDSLDQQRLASVFGIWIFLATEILFFGGLFTLYAVYRGSWPDAFASAARETDVTLGTINTFVLVASSLFVALAVRTVSDASLKLCRLFLGIAIALGIAFLVIKGFEYHADLTEGLIAGSHSRLPPGPERMFFALYWVMTSVHALHLAIGIGLLSVMFRALGRKPEIMRSTARLDVAGLYWHFVDLVWLFLYPLIYLVGRSG